MARDLKLSELMLGWAHVCRNGPAVVKNSGMTAGGLTSYPASTLTCQRGTTSGSGSACTSIPQTGLGRIRNKHHHRPCGMDFNRAVTNAVGRKRL
jgi:hypothetical protein